MSIGAPSFVRYTADGSKAERFERIARAVVEILMVRQPDAVTISAVARRAGVSRPWIYKYFGSEVEALTTFTVEYFGTAFLELDRELVEAATVDEWMQRLVARTDKALTDAERAPWLLRLYMRHRHDPGALGRSMRDLEDRHAERFVSEMPAALKQRKEAKAARQFTEIFSATRNGFYFRWSDPAMREEYDRDALIRQLLALAEQFVA